MIGTRRADNWKLSGDGIIPCDSDDVAGWRRLFEEHQFKSVLNCEGSCALKSCELDPAMSWRINVGAAQNLLEVIQDRDVRVVHLSVDLVFSGSGNGDARRTALSIERSRRALADGHPESSAGCLGSS